ncbi:uncharacterized protein [Physcomitrium patens]|uniref:uncharacterized protein isoform X2 n=1 Tax=Physcomitrium patens TaxID=3218 RepID=UPI003CCE34E6
MARMWFIETAACDREWGVTVNDLRRVSEFECRSSDASTDTKHSADNCNQSDILTDYKFVIPNKLTSCFEEYVNLII